MGIELQPARAKLFLAIMYTEEALMKKALEPCLKKFGAVDLEFGPVNVSSYTNYYKEEMGEGVLKKFMTFTQLIHREELSLMKVFTNNIERGLMEGGKRAVNLDPGYITQDKLVLASTKDFYHRVYLDNGIYAEVTLHFRRGRYRFFSWTYPDYKEKELQTLYLKAKDLLSEEKEKSC